MSAAAVLPALRRKGRAGVLAWGIVLAGLLCVSVARGQDAVEPSGGSLTPAQVQAGIAEATAALDRTRAELAALQKTDRDLQAGMQWIEQRAGVQVLGREFARLLVERLRQLPRPQSHAAAHAARARLLADTSDDSLRVERELLEGDSAGGREDLRQLVDVQHQLIEALRTTDKAQRDLDQHVEAARERLTRLLFWLPALPDRQTLGNLLPALQWMVAPVHWLSAVRVLGAQAAVHAAGALAFALGVIALLALRGWFLRTLVSLAPGARGYDHYRKRHALAAVGITLALTLPGPAALWFVGQFLSLAPDGQAFAHAVGDALNRAARLALGLSAFAWMLDRRGLAVRHFGGDEQALGWASDMLRRLMRVLVPLIFITGLNGLDYAPFANRESLGRLAFTASMIACAVFLAALFRARSPLMAPQFARTPRTWLARLHPYWFALTVAWPLAMAALSGAGYFIAAGNFFARTLTSLFLVLAAVMFYGLVALWVQVQRVQLAGRGAGDDGVPGAPRQLDVAALGEQTRSLLDAVITLLMGVGLWWVWSDALQVLSVIGDYPLWSYSTTEASGEVLHKVTLGHLSLALLVLAITALAVRRSGALLDIMLLQRLDIQADATYAIKVMVQYAVATTGVVIAARIVGISWSDVQWLVAALSVGLGFGLQEIVSNFASGLIILAERPVRIGDMVTVGDVTGTVSRIRARATVVVDGENKEVIIPNKSFITDRVINWTLSSQTTRLVVKFNVPVEYDVARTQQGILDAVRSLPDVLAEPAPSVFFTGFGDSGLEFEVRVFVDALAKRPRVQHEIGAAVALVLREAAAAASGAVSESDTVRR